MVKRNQKRPLNDCVMFLTVKKSLLLLSKFVLTSNPVTIFKIKSRICNLHILNKNRSIDALIGFLNLYWVKQSQKPPLNACVIFLTVKKSPLAFLTALLKVQNVTVLLNKKDWKTIEKLPSTIYNVNEVEHNWINIRQLN